MLSYLYCNENADTGSRNDNICIVAVVVVVAVAVAVAVAVVVVVVVVVPMTTNLRSHEDKLQGRKSVKLLVTKRCKPRTLLRGYLKGQGT